MHWPRQPVYKAFLRVTVRKTSRDTSIRMSIGHFGAVPLIRISSLLFN